MLMIDTSVYGSYSVINSEGTEDTEYINSF